MRILLHSYNYDPEPSGIAPLSATIARGLARRGHDVRVVAAHPHYPAPEWGARRWPYRERRDGIPVLRLPLWVGRATTAERLRQELTFCAGLAAVLPLVPHGDVVVVASPSFPAILPEMVSTGLRRTPWVLWVHDLLPDGAAATDILDEGGLALRAARALERRAYASARQIVTISEGVRQNIIAKGVPAEKVHRIYNPAPRALEPLRRLASDVPPRVLWMGNIGHTQGLAPVVEALRDSRVLAEAGARLRVAGDGVAAGDVRAAVGGAPVDLLGVLHGEQVDDELRGARIGLITQRAGLREFNLPSRMMHFFLRGVPVLASVAPDSETARLIETSGGGWVTDSARLHELPRRLREVLADADEVERRARAAYDFAAVNFEPDSVTGMFEDVVRRAAQP